MAAAAGVLRAQGTGTASPGQPGAPGPAAGRRPVLQGIGLALLLLGGFLLGFAGYLHFLSGRQEARSQFTLYQRLGIELGGQVAPLGATAPGAPVAILNIPAIGLRNEVIVAGTSPENLMLGPGHRLDTPLPGQAGVSQVYGRRATFGAPFGAVPQLRRGDVIRVTTGQGISTYSVVATGGSARLIENPAPNQLLLVTAGSDVVPRYYFSVDADLISPVKAGPAGLPAVYSDETALSSDSGALVLALLWGLALVIVSTAGTAAAARWSPWLAYLATAPVALAVLWNLYQSLAALLPNIY